MMQRPAPSQSAQPAAPTAAPATPQAPAAPGTVRPGTPGTIRIPADGGEPITINVDSRGIHVTQSGAVTTIPLRDVVPRGAVLMTFAVFGSLAFMVVGYPLARAFARWLDRRGSATALSAGVQQRLDAMERNIDTVAVELERVSEGQRFTAKLLEHRSPEHAQRSDR